jgi:pyridoxine 5'-phosphate synthase PdxJ
VLRPERREELTTEGGLDVAAHAARVEDAAPAGGRASA